MEDKNAQEELMLEELIETQSHTIFQLKSLLNNVPGDIYWKNLNGIWLGLNKHCLESLVRMNIIPIPDEQLVIGKTDYDLFDKQTADVYRINDLEVIKTKKEISIEENTHLAGGELIVLHSIKKPLYDADKNVIGIIGNTIDITQMKIIENDLKNAKEQAEAANHAKTEFIANMSHDIRTPLTGVIGLSQLMEQTLNNPDDKEKAHMLHDSGAELLHMLNEILDDIRAEHLKKQDIQQESFDLHQCINDLIHLETPAISLKNLNFQASIAADVPRYIQSDKNKIHRILLNLLGNAIKFTQSGSITLSIESLHQDENKVHLKFRVTDTGIGIPEEMQSQVFNRFFKVNSSYKGIYTGHGLGLHIAQSYATLLGGHITLTSTVGEGSTFCFDLECALAEEPAPLSEKSPSLSSFHLDPKKIRLLLVEDNLIALKTLEMMLSQKGYAFISATTGEEALTIWRTNSIDLIITDIGLPGISGNELTQQIRIQEQLLNKPVTPILGLTGHAREAGWDECYRAGMNEVLSKPAQIETLEQAIYHLLNATSKEQILSKEKTTSLGVDLPATEEELFQLEAFSLFDEQKALEQIPDKALLITLLNTFLSDEIQKDIQQIQQSHEQNDWAKIENLAHKIKGGVAYLGTQKMFYACQYLERYYKAGHRSMLEELYQQLLRVNEQSIHALIEWLKQNN